jgi:general secretion pathway protein D
MKKKSKQTNRLGKTVLIIFTIHLSTLFFTGCSVNHVKLAEDLKKNKKYEAALEQYFRALKAHPDQPRLKSDIDHLLKEASVFYFRRGLELEKSEKNTRALSCYKKSLEFDPGNSEARNALNILLKKGNSFKTIETIKKEMEINTGLPEILKNPERMDLEFGTPTSLIAIFKVLSKTGNVNILFDSTFKDMNITLKLLDITFYDALERICGLNKLSYYVLDSKNIIIAPSSKDSDKRFKKLLIKNIYFSNVDAGEAKKVIEHVFKPDRLTLNEMTNSLVITDSVENIALAEKLAQFIDKRKGEVEIEVEILEVNKKRSREYGTELSTWQVNAAVAGTESGIAIDQLDTIGSDDIMISVPQMVWKFYSSITDSKILARPRVRGLDKEKVSIQLGEQRPIPRTTFVPIATGGVNQQPITSYTMTDVGISITITPAIHHNREVTLELQFELTNVIDIGTSTTPPTLGSRRVNTKLRLRDGETGIIAGLMKGSTTGSRTGIPFLNKVPIIKEIFSSNSKVKERTDILLGITPRVLRMPEISARDLDAYFIGTEEKVELKKWEGVKEKSENRKKTGAVRTKAKREEKRKVQEKEGKKN